MTQLENIEAIEKRLWSAADTLGANSNYASNEYFMPVKGLIFLRHAFSRYLSVKEIPMERKIALLCLVTTLFLLSGCASGPKVTRTEVGETIDLSGRWNDSDSRMVAETLIKDCLNRPWLPRFAEGHEGKQPTVIVGRIVNQSHEHINTQVFVKDLEKALIDSGRVQFVASTDERVGLRLEKMDQQRGFTRPDTVSPLNREIGADFMLTGSVNSVKDEIKGEYVILYQVNLELIDLESNLKAWIGQEKIKKVVERRKFGF